ncbi:hypothetical protein PENSPDRAFT_357993 [Peniophora sp. CONT]|nr:hypothetical protein PENSPDRAFT_357993 [Peniophora sp. CONT]
MDDKRAISLSYAARDAAGPGPSDPPPAYSLERSPSRSSSESSNSSAADYPQTPFPPPPVPTQAPPPATSRLYLSTQRDAITGTYVLDPYAPEIASLDRLRDKPRLPREAKRALKRKDKPSAALASRRGHINVRLIVQNPAPFTGGAVHPQPAIICADTRRGSIYIDIAEKTPNRPISLYTSSRRGSTTVLLPFNFNGTVELHSRHGHTDMLPGLASHARVVRARSREVQFVVGDAAGQDFVRLDSRHGPIRVGLSGVDDGTAMPVPGHAAGSSKPSQPTGGPGMPGNYSAGGKQFRF